MDGQAGREEEKQGGEERGEGKEEQQLRTGSHRGRESVNNCSLLFFLCPHLLPKDTPSHFIVQMGGNEAQGGKLSHSPQPCEAARASLLHIAPA